MRLHCCTAALADIPQAACASNFELADGKAELT
jgi:hypothetical protein